MWQSHIIEVDGASLVSPSALARVTGFMPPILGSTSCTARSGQRWTMCGGSRAVR